jgi:hypothetical protein
MKTDWYVNLTLGEGVGFYASSDMGLRLEFGYAAEYRDGDIIQIGEKDILQFVLRYLELKKLTDERQL